MKLSFVLALCGSFALSACDPPAEDAGEDVAAPTPSQAPTPSPAPAADREGMIPLAAQGRWGLVPEDCNSARSDTKGLMSVSARELRFYESVGRIGAIADSDDTHIRATFAFTGEGMEWTRDMSLTVEDKGATLVRREYGGGDAMPEPLRYTRCK